MSNNLTITGESLLFWNSQFPFLDQVSLLQLILAHVSKKGVKLVPKRNVQLYMLPYLRAAAMMQLSAEHVQALESSWSIPRL